MKVSEFGGILRKMGFCRCMATVLRPVPGITGTQLLLLLLRHKSVQAVVSQRLVQSAVVHAVGAYVS